MQIDVSGTTSQKKIAQIVSAAEFFARCLLNPRMAKNIFLDIDINRKLPSEGTCCSEEDKKNPRFFTIELRGAKGDDDIIKTLAHEMVHLKQYAKNELGKELIVAGKGGQKIVTVWQGKVHKFKSNEDPYYDSPWEIAAYGMEVGLYHKWLSRHDPKMPWYVGADA
jgi:hypothetical protein